MHMHYVENINVKCRYARQFQGRDVFVNIRHYKSYFHPKSSRRSENAGGVGREITSLHDTAYLVA